MEVLNYAATNNKSTASTTQQQSATTTTTTTPASAAAATPSNNVPVNSNNTTTNTTQSSATSASSQQQSANSVTSTTQLVNSAVTIQSNSQQQHAPSLKEIAPDESSTVTMSAAGGQSAVKERFKIVKIDRRLNNEGKIRDGLTGKITYKRGRWSVVDYYDVLPSPVVRDMYPNNNATPEQQQNNATTNHNNQDHHPASVCDDRSHVMMNNQHHLNNNCSNLANNNTNVALNNMNNSTNNNECVSNATAILAARRASTCSNNGGASTPNGDVVDVTKVGEHQHPLLVNGHHTVNDLVRGTVNNAPNYSESLTDEPLSNGPTSHHTEATNLANVQQQEHNQLHQPPQQHIQHQHLADHSHHHAHLHQQQAPSAPIDATNDAGAVGVASNNGANNSEQSAPSTPLRKVSIVAASAAAPAAGQVCSPDTIVSDPFLSTNVDSNGEESTLTITTISGPGCIDPNSSQILGATASETASEATSVVSTMTDASHVIGTDVTKDQGDKIMPNVAIDNKIEQAMDLVKSHLMFAVREEVDVLKERIVELLSRIQLLEKETEAYRRLSPAETVAAVKALMEHDGEIPPEEPQSQQQPLQTQPLIQPPQAPVQPPQPEEAQPQLTEDEEAGQHSLPVVEQQQGQ